MREEICEMQNVTDLLRILGLGMIVPNKSDALNIESDCRPHSSSDPPDGGPPSPRGKAWWLRRILTAKSEFVLFSILCCPGALYASSPIYCTDPLISYPYHPPLKKHSFPYIFLDKYGNMYYTDSATHQHMYSIPCFLLIY